MSSPPVISDRGTSVSSFNSIASSVSWRRFELPGAVAVGVFLPAALKSNMHSILDQPTLVDAGLAAIVAIVLGCYFIRRVQNFPGVQSGVHIPFAVTAAFGFALVILLLFRLEYSRFFVAVSYAATLLWFIGMHLVSERFAKPLVAVVPGGHASVLKKLGGVRWRELSTPEDIGESVSAITADLREDLPDEWERILTEATLHGTPVYHSKTLSESLTGRVEIERLYENSFGSMLPSLGYLKVKFIADWCMALFVLPVFLIAAGIVGLLIYIDSGGPVFYRQERVGYRGRIFQLYKFRTMSVSVGPEANGRAAAMTRNGDERITRVGRVLRRYRVDELPQLINILKGEMSWIGPRPEAKSLSQWYEGELPYYRYRHAVRPGISGWAQVNQGHVALPSDVRTKLHYDFFYIKYLSPWLDMLIALRTVKTVLYGFGAK